ncbi:MAG: CPBP family intramembrane glutamic endopeptidase [Candidatus Sulfotelmatobacter sp.]
MSSPENPQFDSSLLGSEPQAPTPSAVEPLPPPDIQPIAPTPASAENPVWSGWDVLVIAGLTLVTLFFVQLFTVLGARHFAFPHASWMEVAQKPALALLAELLTYVAVALYMILLVEGKYHTRFWEAIRWNWPGMAAMSFIGIGVLMLGLDLLGRLLPMPKSTPFDQFFAHRSDAYLTAVFAVTLGPLMEEIFFRGFLYPVIARRLGVFWGIVLTALPFGLIHMVQYGYAWGAVLIIFLVGVVLTAVRAKTKSVASSFLAHAGYNGTLMVLAVWATDGFRHMEKAALGLF